MKTKKHDFIELNYIARIKDTNQIFDLTNEEEAKKKNIFNPNLNYNPIIICIGEAHVIKGLDKELENKEINKEYKVEIKPEEGFGKKDAKLIQLVSTNKLKQQKIEPQPGMQVMIDNFIGIIKTVSGGRTLIDFNHPLAGKDVVYEFKINKIIKDNEEKVKGLLKIYLNKDIKFKLDKESLTIEEDLPKQVQDHLKENIKRLIPTIKKVTSKISNKE